MVYRLLDVLLGNLLMNEAKKVSKCKACKKRMKKQGEPRLFLLPVYNDQTYSASASYFKQNCVPIQMEEDIPTARRVWLLRCPVCGEEKILVHDFLRVRTEEAFECAYFYDKQELWELLYHQTDGQSKGPTEHMEGGAFSTHIGES